MEESMAVYFDGEKYAGLLLAGVAAAAMIAAVVMFRAAPGVRSFAVTVGVVALAEMALGIGLYARTGPQVRRLVEQHRMDEASFRAAEATRMSRVQRTFIVVEYVELVVIVAAAIVAISQKGRPVLTGVALGLLIHASLLLAFDLFAERRGADYLAAISRGLGPG